MRPSRRSPTREPMARSRRSASGRPRRRCQDRSCPSAGEGGRPAALDRRGLVGREVVTDRVDGQASSHRLVDVGEKPLELDRAVTGSHLGDDVAGGHVQHGVQVGRAVGGAVVGAPLGTRTAAAGSVRCGSPPTPASSPRRRAPGPAWGGLRYSPTMSWALSTNCGRSTASRFGYRPRQPRLRATCCQRRAWRPPAHAAHAGVVDGGRRGAGPRRRRRSPA
jgi:hypothetical protein